MMSQLSDTAAYVLKHGKRVEAKSPLDESMLRLLKTPQTVASLARAIGSSDVGSSHSEVRSQLADWLEREVIELAPDS